MAYKISGGTVQPASNSIAAHNLTHKSAAAAEIASSTKPHYDGVEVTTAGVSELISTTYGVPTTLSDAVNIFNEAKRILNLHYGYHNTGGTAGVFAHKASTTAIAVADLAAGSTFEATLFAAVVAFITNYRTKYGVHLASAVYHSAADTTHVLGGSGTVSTWADAAIELNNMKAQYTGHIADATAHDAADAVNTISAANAVDTDLDSIITLCLDLHEEWDDHLVEAGVHFSNDAANAITASDPALDALLTGGGALPTAIRSSYETHRASTTYHESADGTNTITASAVATVANLIALAAELRTDIDAHIAFAPVSRAQRGV